MEKKNKHFGFFSPPFPSLILRFNLFLIAILRICFVYLQHTQDAKSSCHLLFCN